MPLRWMARGHFAIFRMVERFVFVFLDDLGYNGID